MRVTKTLANQLAVKILAKRKTEIEGAKTRIATFVHNLAMQNIPLLVLEAFKSHPDYVKKSKSYRFMRPNKEGDLVADWDYYMGLENVPVMDNAFTISAAEYEALHGLIKVKNRLTTTYDKDVETLENTLFGLHTIKRVGEEFPEIKRLLPVEQKTALVYDTSKAKAILQPLYNNGK